MKKCYVLRILLGWLYLEHMGKWVLKWVFKIKRAIKYLKEAIPKQLLTKERRNTGYEYTVTNITSKLKVKRTKHKRHTLIYWTIISKKNF